MKIKDYKIGTIIIAKNKMDRGYKYKLEAKYGDLSMFDLNKIKPVPPDVMLKMGVFEGHYMTDCASEFPEEWFRDAKMSKVPDIKCNYYQVKSRMSLQEWKKKGWIIEPDNRGWFQWYCRYYIGRRIPDIDKIQIARHKAFLRHYAQVMKHCGKDQLCRPKQRQALLQWAYLII